MEGELPQLDLKLRFANCEKKLNTTLIRFKGFRGLQNIFRGKGMGRILGKCMSRFCVASAEQWANARKDGSRQKLSLTPFCNQRLAKVKSDWEIIVAEMPIPHFVSVHFTGSCQSSTETGYEKKSVTGEGWEEK